MMATNHCVEPSHLPTNEAGYHIVALGDKHYYRAHVAAYRLLKGDYPRHHILHHTCGNKRCINIEHLVPMSREEHPKAHLSDRCGNQHEPDWYYRPDRPGTRQCRQCRRDATERKTGKKVEARWS